MQQNISFYLFYLYFQGNVAIAKGSLSTDWAFCWLLDIYAHIFIRWLIVKLHVYWSMVDVLHVACFSIRRWLSKIFLSLYWEKGIIYERIIGLMDSVKIV